MNVCRFEKLKIVKNPTQNASTLCKTCVAHVATIGEADQVVIRAAEAVIRIEEAVHPRLEGAGARAIIPAGTRLRVAEAATVEAVVLTANTIRRLTRPETRPDTMTTREAGLSSGLTVDQTGRWTTANDPVMRYVLTTPSIDNPDPRFGAKKRFEFGRKVLLDRL